MCSWNHFIVLLSSEEDYISQHHLHKTLLNLSGWLAFFPCAWLEVKVPGWQRHMIEKHQSLNLLLREQLPGEPSDPEHQHA